MEDPFKSGVALSNIQILGPAGDRSELINGDWLPIKNVDGYTIRAQQRRVVGRNQDAIDDYDKALEIAPDSGDLYFYKGQTYVAMEKKEDAIAAFETAALLFKRAGIDRESAARRWIRRLQHSQSQTNSLELGNS
ncbi:MAG: tetratricopeptide repeat protein [Cyanobacteria bacterium J06614_10]